MSGPLSSDEIEDVVSSVRRLVSIDPRPRTPSRDPGPDRLVLTSALRVVAEDVALQPLILTERTQDPGTPADSPDTGFDASPATIPDPAVHPEWEDELWADPVAPLAEMALEAEEAVLVSPSDDLDPDLEAALTLPEVPSIDPEPAAPTPILRASRASRRPRAMPPVDPALTDAAESVVMPAPEPTAFAAQAAGGTTAASDGEVTAIPTTLIDADGTPVRVMDEAALNDIIRQMIREELRGVLGERITHNVRKLVRAEINRALTARALD